MADIVLMPALSDTMEEGVIAEWHKKVGDEVKVGDVLAEIESDKATLEFESFFEGTLLYVAIDKGEGLGVNELLAIIGEKGENIDAILADAKATSNTSTSEVDKKNEVSKEVVVEQEEKKVASVVVEKTVAAPSKTEIEQPTQPGGDDRIFASPLAKKLALDKGIDLNNVIGTGENGRIVKRDIEYYVPYERPQMATASYSRNVDGNLQESYTEENISQMRKVIAKRLSESKFTAPHFYLTIDIDMDNAIVARKAINAKEGYRISFNDMIIKASAMALQKHPAVNSSWLGDKIRRNNHINIGVAVAVPEGLLVPVVRFADTKGMMQIGAEVKDFASRARDKKLQPEEWQGNTFTISNLGMYNIEEFTAIINSPDSCILAVGGIKKVPIVKNDQIVPGNVMRVTLSCDHRVVDGATGSEFLNTFKMYMETPMMMLV